jgi:hypothetical protein
MDPVHARTYAGKRVAVDAYAWSATRTQAAGEKGRKVLRAHSLVPSSVCGLLAAGCIVAHTHARKNSASDSQRISQALDCHASGESVQVVGFFWALLTILSLSLFLLVCRMRLDG